MDLKPGSRWRSAVCDAEIVIVKPPTAAVVLECGGHAVKPHSEPKAAGLAPAPDHAAGSQLGKRYVDEETSLEALCSKTGAGSLSVDGRPLALKEAKKLPSSD
jgi:hypothetical protein